MTPIPKYTRTIQTCRKNPSSPFVDQLPTGGQEQRQHQGGQLAPKKSWALPLNSVTYCHTLSHTVTQCHTMSHNGTVRCRSLWKNACRDTCSRPRDTCGDCRQSLVKGFGGIGCSQFFVFFLMNVICNMIDHPKPAPSKTFSQFCHSNIFFTVPHPTIHESFTMYQWVARHVCFITLSYFHLQSSPSSSSSSHSPFWPACEY